MIVTISRKEEEFEKIYKILLASSLPIFSHFETEEKFCTDNTAFKFAKGLIVCGINAPDKVELICQKFKASVPDARIGVIMELDKSIPMRFKYVPSADNELICPKDDNETLRFIEKLYCNIYSKERIFQSRFPLYISIQPPKAVLIGYDLMLTASELRILAFLKCHQGEYIPSETIAKICFLAGSSASISSMICKINRKAKIISNRKLIKCKKGWGYYLNPEI